MTITRREFLKLIGSGLVLGSTGYSNILKNTESKYIKEARFYKKLGRNITECNLCPNNCLIKDGNLGDCEVRINDSGSLKSLVYNRLCSLNNDPIEKKPLYHFLPGTKAVSVATAGCNLECKFCQNYKISQVRPGEVSSKFVTPEKLINLVRRYNSSSIAYTYSEPTVFYEYMYDTAKLCQDEDIKNVMISGGYMNQEPLKELCEVLDGIKIDLKGFTERFYRTMVSGELDPVLETMKTIKENDTWLEIVYLVIPTHNDSMDEIKRMSNWVAENLGTETPVHFSRFFPRYLMKNLPSTPIETLDKAMETAKNEGLDFVYIGNVPEHKGSNTNCPNCGELLVERTGYMIDKKNIKNGKCNNCGRKMPGIWS